LIERHSRSMKVLSMKRPRPSIEISTPTVTSLLAKASAVKVEPRTVLKVRGFPNRSSASRRPSFLETAPTAPRALLPGLLAQTRLLVSAACRSDCLARSAMTAAA